MAKTETGGGSVEVPGGPGIPATTTRRDPSNPTPFSADPRQGAPFVDPAVSDPRAAAYAQQAASRRRPAPIPRYTDAVAGGPDVAIPRLDSEAMGGVTMAQQAEAVRGQLPRPSFVPPQEPALSGMPVPAGIVTGHEHLAPTAAAAPRPGGLVMPGGLLPTDLLAETARNDPNYKQGHGSHVAMNQPELAYKYGVMRDGRYIAGQALRAATQPPRPGGQKPQAQLSQNTLDSLSALQRFNEERARTENPAGATDQKIAEEAAAGPAGGAGATRPPMSEDDKKNLLDNMDDFDITKLRNALYKDLLNNEEQKKIIESRLKPLELSDLIITGRVTQTIPIRPGLFEPEFQSYSGDEDLYIKRMLGIEMENLKPMNNSLDRYITDKYVIMGLTVAVKSINKQQFPSVYNEKGEWDEELFWKKYALVSKFDYHMIGSLVTNWFWFDLRVRHLFKAEALGNG